MASSAVDNMETQHIRDAARNRMHYEQWYSNLQHDHNLCERLLEANPWRLVDFI